MPHLFAAFIRERKHEIIARWMEAAQELPSARALSALAIRDHIPEMLDELAAAIDRFDMTDSSLKNLPNLHAALRLRDGYDLHQIVSEYRMLRLVIFETFAEKGPIADEARPRLAPLRIMNAALDTAIADAVDQVAIERERSRQLFMDILSHDLRDPLNAIAIGARVLWHRAEALDPNTLKIVARISASADRMEALIRDLLDVARVRLGVALPIVPGPVDACALMASVVEELSMAHPDRIIQGPERMAPGSGAVCWDGARITQAMSNLLSNALTHGTDPIVVEMESDTDTIIVQVRNRGEISPEALPSLFAPFANVTADRRGEDSASVPIERRRGSLGLGLYIVKQIVEAHGGAVTAESTEGSTTFRLRLPRIAPG